jgi:hypothetical protein
MKHKMMLTIIITLLCTTIYAQAGTPGLSFTLIGNGTAYSVSRGTASATHIEIPSTHNGLPVTMIANNGFTEFTQMTSITIPNSVITIGSGAFNGCTGLTEITIPNSVTSIGNGAFYGCTGLTEITIPNSVTTIGDGAFYGCTGLTSITIPNSVTTIGLGAFWDCTSLTSVIFDSPSSLTSIGVHAFAGCTSLTEITIPNSVTVIGAGAFWGCTGLTSVIFDSPSSVTTIVGSAFGGCTGLTEITIPNSVTGMGAYAFGGCTGLTEIIIPSSVASIGDAAFSGCTSLTIYAEALSRPSGWHPNWNPDNRPVIWGHITSEDDITQTAFVTSLQGNYPNPFNPTTTIGFAVASEEEVSIVVYNLKGQRVRTLVSGVYRAGSRSVVWDGTDDAGRAVSSGVYFYRMVAGEYSEIKRMMLLK